MSSRKKQERMRSYRQTTGNKPPKKGMNRRDFLGYSGGLGLLMGLGSLFGAHAADGTGDGLSKDANAKTESRSLQFDLSRFNPDHEYFISLGDEEIDLAIVTGDNIKKVRNDNALLENVPEKYITHFVEAVFPENAPSICTVWGRDPSDPKKEKYLAMNFLHLPKTALDEAGRTANSEERPAALKWNLYPEMKANYKETLVDSAMLSDPVLNADFKNAFDHAQALTFFHPNLMSMEPKSATQIHNNIIGQQPATLNLANVLQNQGENWAELTTLKEFGDPSKEAHYDFKDPRTGEHFAGPIRQTVWSDETKFAVGQAIAPSLQKALNDTTLGANVTGTQANSDETLNGKVWFGRDGSGHERGAATKGDTKNGTTNETGPKWTVINKDADQFWNVILEKYDAENKEITLRMKNYYARTLSLGLKYLDGEGNPIPMQTYQNDWPIKSGMCWHVGGEMTGACKEVFSTETVCSSWMASPILTMMGIPLRPLDVVQSFKVDPNNISPAKIQVVTSSLGMGNYSEDPQAYFLGIGMTTFFSFLIPTIFLCTGAAAAFKGFTVSGYSVENMDKVAKSFLDPAFMASFWSALTDILNGDIIPGIFAAGSAVLILLFGNGLFWYLSLLIAAILGANLVNAIPIVGQVILAASSLGLAASLTETAVSVLSSAPNSYTDLAATHDVTMTIQHDPKHPAGFPETAKTFEIIAQLQGNKTKPIVFGPFDMPKTTQRAPLRTTLRELPWGGNIKFSIKLLSDTGWAAGQGTTNWVKNNTASHEIIITENKVPITRSTVYSHKQKNVYKAGAITWLGTTTPPSADMRDLSCGNVSGGLCKLVGITVNETTASVGYAWQAYSDNPEPRGGQSKGQLFQFGNLSFSQNPQDAHFQSTYGFNDPMRMAYAIEGNGQNYWLDSRNGNIVVRKVNLTKIPYTQKPSYDDSEDVVARFNLSSDALAVHPSGALVSLNSRHCKMEVVDPANNPVPLRDAPLASVYSGQGSRYGLTHGPISAAITAKGSIIILESYNRRIQAFDIVGNPIPQFKKSSFSTKSYFMALHDYKPANNYLDIAVEDTGFIYILFYEGDTNTYCMDIHDPEGAWMSRTRGVVAGRLAVDLWRNVLTLNYEKLEGSPVVMPSISKWIPSTP